MFSFLTFFLPRRLLPVDRVVHLIGSEGILIYDDDRKGIICASLYVTDLRRCGV